MEKAKRAVVISLDFANWQNTFTRDLSVIS